VKAGQVLASLDENDLRLSMESALAEHRSAMTNKSQALAEEARYGALRGKGVVSQSEYDLKHLLADEARARLDKAARSLELAKNRLHYANLLCSTDGVVTKTNAEAGQVVAPGQTVVTVAKDGALEVLVNIPEVFIADIRNAEASVSLWSNKQARYPATLRETAPEADAATRTYAVRFSLSKVDDAVRLGMTATLTLKDPDSGATARIPARSLCNFGDGQGVWVVTPKTGALSYKPVTVVRYGTDSVYVRGQLAQGEILVASGGYKLDKDMTVRVAQGDPGSAQ
jgi:RND family efflux transporter MFP subunit